ncbi:MAG: tRNA-guanine transglycosylase DpdA [Dehalococcoidia bacterium]|nr:tRNA-guanine transglycosylase DpdA [Dehalococcoidia bacterium]
MVDKRLLILGCSNPKRASAGILPALDRYDGPAYRVLRKFLRERQWPQDVSIAILSAKYGLFGSLKGIEDYDQRMSPEIVGGMIAECSTTLGKWMRSGSHRSVHLSLGKDYIPAVRPGLDALGLSPEVFSGGIGEKLHQIKNFLNGSSSVQRDTAVVEAGTGRTMYFLPDWDDLLDPEFDFEDDSFSGKNREERGDRHCSVLMQPKRMSDGILVSLAQQGSSKGPLRRLEGTEDGALAPLPLRSQFGLSRSQYLFGDCGAFSYLNEDQPTITVDQAVALYELYNFDFGASVDHIPVRKVNKDGVLMLLSEEERQERVNITRNNAKLFIETAKERKAQFNPVGTIQGLSSGQYAQAIGDYYEMGYRHVALGGLVPLNDNEIEEIVRAVDSAANKLKNRPWIHLFGVFRPRLQELFRQLKIDSFDSATYFRKAWLRSSQNYLGANGEWYAALRVPMTSDGRTRKRLEAAGADIPKLKLEEQRVIKLLHQYDTDTVNLDEVLDAILSYDQHLARSSETQSMRERYRRTLEQRPWRECDCPFCQELGIHILIFRGANRNKRRGAHNTLMLYENIHENNADIGDIL